MNVLAESYIPDQISAYAIRMRAAWRLACIELDAADEYEAAGTVSTP